MKNDEEYDDDQTSTRLKVHDRTRVLDSGRSVIMIAWRAGVWRRNLKALLFIVLIIGAFLLWRVVSKSEHSAKSESSDSSSAPVAAGGVDYQQVGRGLVYSCTSNQFFCVDKNNYYKCRDLMRSGKSECLTRGVLESNKLCQEEVQNKKSQKITCP